jgi:CBS domain containing-hemolysin-like protein
MTEALIIFAMLLMSGFFSGSEIGYVAANRLRLEIKARQDNVRGRYMAYFLRNPDTFLSTTLVGNNVVNVTYATLMTLFLAAPLTQLWGWLLGQGPTEITMLVLQTIIASVLILIMGELIPKSIFRVHADRLVPIIILPIGLTNVLLRPFIWLANSIAQSILRLFHPESDSVQNFFKREDFETIFREIGNEAQGDMDEDDSEILTNVLEMSVKRVKESMIPRTEIEAIDNSASLEEVLNIFITSGYSKVPVYEGSIDNITGVIFAYDLFKKPQQLEEIIRPVKYVPSSQRSAALLSEFRQQNISLAVVIDEYGGTAGLVTIEDLIEEVVGDIQDEYDTEATIMRKTSSQAYIFSGNVEIEDIEERFPELGLKEEESDFETIAGLIMNIIGRIPKAGEVVRVDGLEFTIVKAAHSRIEIVKCTVAKPF